MFLIKLFNIFKGYVIITVKGLFLERFLNICTRRGICLWNIKRMGKTEMTACIGIDNFKKLIPISKKAYCSVKIRRKRGVPFFLHRHRKRKALVIGAALFLIMLAVVTRFVWVVEVSGNERVESKMIVAALAENGVKPGIRIKEIDTLTVQNRLMTDIGELSYVGLVIKGTTAVVEVRERNIVPPAFPRDTPCSVVARRAGVIERADVTEGEKLTAVGDVVTKGQILISGILEGEISGIRYVHSDGEIIARTWHEKTVELPQYKEIRTPTGNKKSKHSLSINEFYIKFYLNDRISFKNYDRISYVKNLSLGGGIVLPVAFHYDSYAEQKVKQAEMSLPEVVEMVGNELENSLSGVEIVKKQHRVDGNRLTVTFECLENIMEKVGF